MPKARPTPAHRGRHTATELVPAAVEAQEERVSFHPSWMLLAFFAALIAAGTFLLYLPSAAAGAGQTSLLDAFFTATSAATGTGLVVHDTASFWSHTGHWMILLLMQLGGLASLVGSTIFLLLIVRRVSHEERFLFREFMGVQSTLGMVLLVLGVTLYALLIEAGGAYLLASRLSASLPLDQAWWLSIFHTASAFNNAGFEIMDMGQRLPEVWVQLILGGLSLLGAISFIVVVDLVRGVFLRPLALDTKLVFITSALLLAVGTGTLMLAEADNLQSLGGLPFPQRVVSAFFHSAAARTSGLATANLAAFSQVTVLVLVALMFIGGASGSTAGGVKVNTFALLAAVTWSFVRGRKQVSVLGRTVHEEQVYRALAIAFLSLMLVFIVTLVLSLIEGPALLAQLFEVVSAFSTTGFSLGITPTLSPAGKLLIAFTMFVGRVGPLTIAFALSQRHRPSRQVYAQEAINLG